MIAAAERAVSNLSVADWWDSLRMLGDRGWADYRLYAAIDYCLTCEAKAGNPAYCYPALAAELYQELAISIGRLVREGEARCTTCNERLAGIRACWFEDCPQPGLRPPAESRETGRAPRRREG